MLDSRGRRRVPLMFPILLILVGSGSAEPEAHGSDPTALLGTWECGTEEGTVRLIFQSSSLLVFDGESTTYSLAPGVIRVPGYFGDEDYSYALDGDRLVVTFPMGYEYVFERVSATAAEASASQPAMHGAITDLRALLLSSAWCSFSFTGGGSTGYSTTRSSRVQFLADGTYTRGSRSEVYSSGSGGTHAGQHDGGSDGRWEVRNGVLYISEGFGPLQPVRIEVQYNSAGSPIIVADGTEYCRCR